MAMMLRPPKGGSWLKADAVVEVVIPKAPR